MKKVVIITGTPTKPSRLHGVVDYVSEQIKELGLDVHHIDVVDMPAEDLLHANWNSPVIQAANQQISKADAVVIATPIYKASYTGILKAFLDLIPEKGLENKLLLPIIMGGTKAHLLMMEYALKPVLSVLGANQIEAGVFIHDSEARWADDGKVIIDTEVNNRLTVSVEKLCKNIMK
ncbi:NADPH-dependent FMN reductase [Bacillus tuaregi]|uniref:NADPH-dependent FMN reductase n=1 Tax=Bacillus tuaregi TaxID=1816695 RepID=UPI0008F925CA|nr:NADPH-dependent FMN reductase [Bacillus tuaregi]